MSRKKRFPKADNAASSALGLAHPAAAQLKPVASQVKPLAKSTGAAARRQARRTRAWAAPQVERTGQVLQDSVAPKVSALLSSAAQRLEPAKPRHRRWPKPVGIAAVTAAGSAVAAFVRNRRKPGGTSSATPAGTEEMASAAEMPDGHVRTSTEADADTDGQVRSS